METPAFSHQLRLMSADMGKMDAGGVVGTNFGPPERFWTGLASRLAC